MTSIIKPESKKLKEIARAFKMQSNQINELIITVIHIVNDLQFHNDVLSKQPRRADLIRRLDLMAKALSRLEIECNRNIDQMEFFLPHDTLQYIGQSMTFSAMGEALNKDVYPTNFGVRVGSMSPGGEDDILASLEDFSRPARQALGLKYGHILLKHFVEKIYAPIKKWRDVDRLNRGGRIPDLARQYIIYKLAEAAPRFLGKEAPVSGTGPFFELCKAVVIECKLPTDGLNKSIPRVVKKLRSDQAQGLICSGAT